MFFTPFVRCGRSTSRAIHDLGIDGFELMSRAAQAALDVALDRYRAASRWQILCGGGNNAGDGYVLARLAMERGMAVSVLALADPANLEGDALTAGQRYLSAGGRVEPWSGALDAKADLLIDGLLGSGLARDVTGSFAAAVAALNRHPAPVLALDIPTGIHGDTGATLGAAVLADATVTFVGHKTGLYLAAGPPHAGTVFFSDLGIPRSARDGQAGVLRRLNDRGIRRAFPRRPRSAHKADFGHLLIVGGGPGMPGAVRLAGEAALRSGAGLVSIATHPTHAGQVPGSRPELMCRGVKAAPDLDSLLSRATVVAVGPGLGQSAWARELFERVLLENLPMVLDADALNLLSERPVARANWILTPHPGEAGRLLGCPAADVQADRPRALQQLLERYSGTVILKGAGTLSSDGTGLPWLCSDGNPGMAVPGMGDILTGMVGSFRAQGFAADAAAALAVAVHARAGDRAALAGERGLLASDLFPAIRDGVNG